MAAKILELDNFANTDTVATAATAIINLIDAVKAMYPVGSVITTTTNSNPSTYLGGTWVVYGAGKFLVGAGGTYTLGATGGTEKHQHMTAMGFDKNFIFMHYKLEGSGDAEEAPYYGSTVQTDHMRVLGNSTGSALSGDNAHTHTIISDTTGYNRTGYTESVSNLPPYVCVYFWQRTA